MFQCCDCGVEIDERDGAERTMPNADGSATIQCVPCHVRAQRAARSHVGRIPAQPRSLLGVLPDGYAVLSTVLRLRPGRR